jgi:sterol desaturase/sphingolipid hydroxylase (fatty acid hydroxylase superfamily)
MGLNQENSDALSGKNGLASGASSPQGSRHVKQIIFDHLPPATIAAVLLFWGLAPTSLTSIGWMPVAVSMLISFYVLGLEQLHERHAGWRLNKQEFFTDLFYVIFASTAISWCVTLASEQPLLALKASLGITTPWITSLPFLIQVAMVIVLFEFGQYWMHRLMHNNSFFWSLHAPHHHITQLNAMKGYVGHPLEIFLIGLGVVALFDFKLEAIFAAFGTLGVISTFNHANVLSNPPIWYGYFFTTIRNHSLHHTALSYEDTRCNYGNSLILMDRIFGTYREGESAVVGQDDRRRLSIWEQVTFPIRPWLEKSKQQHKETSSVNS